MARTTACAFRNRASGSTWRLICVCSLALTRRDWPVDTTCPTTPELSGTRSSPPFDPERRAADENVVRAVPKKDARAIGMQQLRGRLGHLDQQRLHLVGLIPLAGDRQNRLQPFDASPIVLARGRAVSSAAPSVRASSSSVANGGRADERQKTSTSPEAAWRHQRHGHPRAVDGRLLAVERVGQQTCGNGARRAEVGADQPAASF